MRKIVYITGTRADYGLMRSTLLAIDRHPKLELFLIVVGMHLSRKHGYTLDEIKKDKLKIKGKIRALINDKNNPASMSKNLGHYIIKVTEILEKVRPDIVLVEGDRGEALAGAIAGVHLGIVVVHMSGGDATEGGMVDDSIRHAITKFAHIHFPGTKESAQRIRNMLEEPERIYMVGTPDILTQEDFSKEEKRDLASKLCLDVDEEIIVMLQHPVTNETNQAGFQIQETLEAVANLKKQTVVIYPNSDAGSNRMIEIINKYSHSPFIKAYKNFPYRDFMCLLSIASVMVGNSSAGISRAPGFGLPFVNVGNRQKGRERSNNVQDVEYDRTAIRRAIEKALRSKRLFAKKIRSPYQKLPTDRLVANILSKIKIDKSLLVKKIVRI